MIKSFVLNLGRGIELIYNEGPGEPDISHPVNTDNDIVIKGFIDGDYNAEDDAVSEVGLYLNRADILRFLNEIMNNETPATALDFEDPSEAPGYGDYCKIIIAGGVG